MNIENTKNLAKCLSILAENGFVVLSADFETGQISVVAHGFDAVPVATKKAPAVDPNAPDAIYKVNENEKRMIRDGRFIEAIKALRGRTNLGLAEAKELCERWRRDFDSGIVF